MGHKSMKPHELYTNTDQNHNDIFHSHWFTTTTTIKTQRITDAGEDGEGLCLAGGRGDGTAV